MIAQHVEHTRRIDRFFIFALTQTRPRGAGRLGEHGRHTHPLRVAFARELVNRTRMASDYFFCDTCGQITLCSAVALASAALNSATSALKAFVPSTSLRSRSRFF